MGCYSIWKYTHSEQVHMDRMETLITTHKLSDPVAVHNGKHGSFVNTVMQQYYDEVVALGTRSLTDALKAGAKIEELDIADLEERMKRTKIEGILDAFELLDMGSYNHLRAFVRRLKMQGVEYQPVILTREKFDKIIAAEGKMCGKGRGCE